MRGDALKVTEGSPVVRTSAHSDRKRAYVNSFDLIAFALILACGGFGAEILARLGTAAGMFGFVLGIGLGSLTYWTLCRLMDMWDAKRPLRPICKNGRCAAADYALIALRENGVFYCRCGTTYIRKGLRFMELNEDGSCTPYMRRRWFLGKWEKDLDARG